jgi:hypothetical protein
MTELTSNTPIQSGPHSLYWHASEGRDWSLPSFKSLESMKTVGDWHARLGELGVDSLSDGMFFLMRDPIPPLWENAKNVYGGAYSFRILKRDAGKAFETYATAMMDGNVTVDPANRINGLSISPKKTHNIIKVWNTDSSAFNKPSDLLKLWPDMVLEDILYTPFTQKKM